ncbi:MAG: methylenetetrahydrofolate--tRNA-(uracil(54)-C(5))-methyltransferase (FADH(2)-oxidizing) TrmFO [Bilophila sp.]
MTIQRVAIVGAGLAGCECALQLARRGFGVTLFEQKPAACSPAHSSPQLAELVCSNSFRSDEIASGIGLLKQELRELGSALMSVADATRVPAGKALAVDRELFAAEVTALVEAEENITLIRKEIPGLDAPELDAFERVVIAAGPLASEHLSASLSQAVGGEHLYFYDAIAPIVAADSIDLSVAFWGSRYEEPGAGDYLNCPMTEEEYRRFYAGLLEGDKVASREFEEEKHFEGCMPVEALAERGDRTLVFGPLKPVGFTDPRTGRRPYALLQLRPENSNRTMFNLVGCQTKMTYAAQSTCFRLVPGLEHAEFVRFGSMHRNTYVNAPTALNSELALCSRPRIHLAGQITGVEGYVESMACGLWVGMLLAHKFEGTALAPPPVTTALGALLAHLAMPSKRFQPSNVHFGLMPEPEARVKKKERKAWYAARARAAFAAWLGERGE